MPQFRFLLQAMDNPQRPLVQRLEELFSTIDAAAQIVLKGHLLVEETLDRILGKFVFHAEYFQSANLRFAQKIDLARSICLDDHNDETWELVKAINSLRNELAHSLNSEKRQKKSQRVIELYLKLLDDTDIAAHDRAQPPEVLLMWAAAFCLGFLSGLEAEVDRFKGIVNTLDRVVNSHRHPKKTSSSSDS